MIELNVDFSLLNKFFGIAPSKIPQYANMDIDEIMKEEAKQGNQKAADYEKILSDPNKIFEIFKLANLENKYIILQNMSEDDLDNLLPFLKHDQLLSGLYFFTDEKLLTMCEDLPIEQIVGMVFEKFQLFDVMKFMDDSSFDAFLKDPKAERKYSKKYFETLTQKDLEKIMIKAYGYDQKGKHKDEYLKQLEELEDSDYMEFLCSFDRFDKMNLINGMCYQEEDLLLLFEPQDLIKPMDMLMQPEKIKMMGVLDDEFIIPMIEELPMDLTQIVLTQIDPRIFSEVLAEDFKNILSSVVLFSTK